MNRDLISYLKAQTIQTLTNFFLPSLAEDARVFDDTEPSQTDKPNTFGRYKESILHVLDAQTSIVVVIVDVDTNDIHLPVGTVIINSVPFVFINDVYEPQAKICIEDYDTGHFQTLS